MTATQPVRIRVLKLHYLGSGEQGETHQRCEEAGVDNQPIVVESLEAMTVGVACGSRSTQTGGR